MMSNYNSFNQASAVTAFETIVYNSFVNVFCRRSYLILPQL